MEVAECAQSVRDFVVDVGAAVRHRRRVGRLGSERDDLARGHVVDALVAKGLQRAMEVAQVPVEAAVCWRVYLAFHLHNTGKPYPADGQPTTFHPDYVQRGMAYMRKFAEDARQ